MLSGVHSGFWFGEALAAACADGDTGIFRGGGGGVDGGGAR